MSEFEVISVFFDVNTATAIGIWLGIAVSSIGAIIGSFRWLNKKGEERQIETEKKMLGPEQNGRDGWVGKIRDEMHSNAKDVCNQIQTVDDKIKNLQEQNKLIVTYIEKDIVHVKQEVYDLRRKVNGHYTTFPNNTSQRERDREGYKRYNRDQE